MYSNPRKLNYKKPKQTKYIPVISLSKSQGERLSWFAGTSFEYGANCQVCKVIRQTNIEKIFLMKKGENFDDEDDYSSGAWGIPRYVLQALYRTYSSSQNYYYVRDINNILAKKRIPCYIFHRDLEDFYLDQGEDQLKRYYYVKEYNKKIGQLVEYYKYHVEIPRLFVKEAFDLYFDYHDKKRQIEYVRVKSLLNKDEDQNCSILNGKNESRKNTREQNFIPILKFDNLDNLQERQTLYNKKGEGFTDFFRKTSNTDPKKKIFKEAKYDEPKRNVNESNVTLDSVYNKLKRAIDCNVSRSHSRVIFSCDISHLSDVTHNSQQNHFNNINVINNDKVILNTSISDHIDLELNANEAKKNFAKDRNLEQLCSKQSYVFKKRTKTNSLSESVVKCNPIVTKSTKFHNANNNSNQLLNNNTATTNANKPISSPFENNVNFNFNNLNNVYNYNCVIEDIKVKQDPKIVPQIKVDNKTFEKKPEDVRVSKHIIQPDFDVKADKKYKDIMDKKKEELTSEINELLANKKKIEISKMHEAILHNEEKIRSLNKKKKLLKHSEKDCNTKSQFTNKDTIINVSKSPNIFSSKNSLKFTKNIQSARVPATGGYIYSKQSNDNLKISVVSQEKKENNTNRFNKNRSNRSKDSYTNEINPNLFFEKKSLENLVEIQKTSNMYKVNMKQQAQEAIKKNLANNFQNNSKANKVVKVYSARPDWPGSRQNQNSKLNNHKSTEFNGNNSAYNFNSSQNNSHRNLDKAVFDINLLSKKGAKKANDDIVFLKKNTFEQQPYNIINNDNPKKNSQKHNSTRSINQNVLTFNSNSLKHSRQKSSVNLNNEFVIRKLSFNEVIPSSNEVKQQKAIFDSRKASHENANMILGKKSPNISKLINNANHRGSKNIMKLSDVGFHSHKPSHIFQTSENNFLSNISPVKEIVKPTKSKIVYKVESCREPLNDYSSKKKIHERISSQIKGIDQDFLKKDFKNFTSSTKNLVKSKPRHQKSYSNNMALNLVSHRSTDKNDTNMLVCSSLTNKKKELLYLHNKHASESDQNLQEKVENINKKNKPYINNTRSTILESNKASIKYEKETPRHTINVKHNRNKSTMLKEMELPLNLHIKEKTRYNK